MIVEISVAIIAGMLSLLVLFLVAWHIKIYLVIKGIQRTLHLAPKKVSKNPPQEERTVREEEKKVDPYSGEETLADALDWAVSSIGLIHQIKGYLRYHGKKRR